MGNKVIIKCTERYNVLTGVKPGKRFEDVVTLIRGDCKDGLKGDCLNCNLVKAELYIESDTPD